MHPRLVRALPALALILAVASAPIAGCSSNSDNSTAPPVVTGPTFSFAFPATGTSLTSPGTSNKRVFTSAEVGSWDYRCVPHSGNGMTGTVTVDAAAPTDSAVVAVGAAGPNPGNLNFVPKVVSIKPDGYVRWVNVSNMIIHTVTR